MGIIVATNTVDIVTKRKMTIQIDFSRQVSLAKLFKINIAMLDENLQLKSEVYRLSNHIGLLESKVKVYETRIKASDRERRLE